MRLPRDVGGRDLARHLQVLGYAVTRQAGSHLRLTTERHGQHHVTVPLHDPIKLGTLSGILGDVANHHDLTREQLVDLLFGRGH
jgi:predicted RNA binding protein YcfA (HicA-like mRNA interferase family)